MAEYDVIAHVGIVAEGFFIIGLRNGLGCS
jgi:hypothetical protein